MSTVEPDRGGDRERILVGMSGGVDSSVAAAELVRQGYEVVGVTLKLWGGESDSGCCSVSDVDDARRVAQQLGIDHLVFNFADDFTQFVVDPYVDDHRHGVTPNPCIECNRKIKFDRLIERAALLGFDRVATGHYAQVGQDDAGAFTLARGVDADKDQSYVVHMLNQHQLSRTLFPLGGIPKSQTRSLAAELGLRTAAKPDSQDVCFIAASQGGREAFLGNRIAVRPGRVVDTEGTVHGEVAAVELVTIGQRRGLGLVGGGPKRYVVDVDVESATVVVGGEDETFDEGVIVDEVTWINQPHSGAVRVQCSAHGVAHLADLASLDSPTLDRSAPRTPATDESATDESATDESATDASATGALASGTARAQHTRRVNADGATSDSEPPDRVYVRWSAPQRRVAPGQSVVFYDAEDHLVLGGGIARRNPVDVG